MAVYTVDCGMCHGRPVERLEERATDDTWHHNATLDPALADAWIKADPIAPLRWQEVACPRCNGTGEYEVESVPCKIF